MSLMQPNLFTLFERDFEKVNQIGSIRLIANLLWAESVRYNIPKTDITLSFDINTPDGGIDAKIETENPIVGDLIRDKRSYYQIKSGKFFKPNSKTSFPYVRDWLNEHPYRNESNARLVCNLYNGGTLTPKSIWKIMDQLKKRIKRLLENWGR